MAYYFPLRLRGPSELSALHKAIAAAILLTAGAIAAAAAIVLTAGAIAAAAATAAAVAVAAVVVVVVVVDIMVAAPPLRRLRHQPAPTLHAVGQNFRHSCCPASEPPRRGRWGG